MKFQKLFEKHKNSNLSPGIWQRRIEKSFTQLVSDSHLNNWHTSDCIPNDKTRILVGVAPGWNELDMRILDCVEQSISNNDFLISVDVFDTSNCQSIDDLHEYIPGIDTPYQTPIVGIWKGGKLIETVWGYEGRQKLSEIFRFSPL